MARKDHEKKRWSAIGLMSGTSMDGIDVALLVTNGKTRVERGPGASYPYEAAFRRKLAAALETAKAIEKRTDRPGDLADLEREIATRHAEAVKRFLDENHLRLSDIDVVGFHGQTVLHRPAQGVTVQLGDAKLLAAETGLPVVHDLRAADMELGGQGAPLVPVYHRALAENLPKALSDLWPVAFVNIGGIANISWISREGEMIAFDTGPGNALIDQWVAAKGGIPYDQGGAIAAEGSVDAALAGRYLSESFFQQPAPKSLDRNDFLPPAPDAATLEDGAMTLAHVTAASILKAFEHVPEAPRVVIICGGGRNNRAIMGELARLLQELPRERDDAVQLLAAEEAGFDGDSMEAEAWAYLAVRSLRGLKITWPGTTGVSKGATGGLVAYPDPGKP
ncbi:MAG TPA: anhydro-N-acetylmuramic acid kinase [Rhizobiaceae bacterium]|nr:anhydro-N-acetylmuramic acid kinase [Rhizobiaceae bacterium]